MYSLALMCVLEAEIALNGYFTLADRDGMIELSDS